MASEWFENTGEVPEGVGHDTLIEVEYKDGEQLVWWQRGSNRPYLWFLIGDHNDIIRWRFA